jgi:hypothetical protein
LSKIRLGDYCCQAGDRLIDQSKFDLDSLVISRRGKCVLRFSPLGNCPSAPKLALVGITPGSQSESFAKLLRSNPVRVAAKAAAFAKGQEKIKKLLNAHGFAKFVGIDLEGDLNENPALFTTSLVKCCLMVDGSYKYKAPDIAASPEATFCVTYRFIEDIARFPTLRWVVIFGDAGWQAVKLLKVGRLTIRQHLESQRIVVLNFPHFAQNFQQQAIFMLRPEEEEAYFKARPAYRSYAPAAREMRSALLSALGHPAADKHDRAML